MSSRRVWFITGAASGFGRTLTELVLRQGEAVVATDIAPATLNQLQSTHPKSLLVHKLDVAQPDEIKNAFAVALERFGRIDVVFNNAGYTVVGEVEGTSMEAARALFDVLFWGATQVSIEAIRIFREANKPPGGRLITTSSLMGVVSSPVAGYYSAAKHAIEGLSASLAAELDPEWNIRITLVEPAMFRTGGVAATKVHPVHPAYNKPSLPSTMLREMLNNPEFFPNDPEKAAKVLFRLSNEPNPPLKLALSAESVAAIKASLDQQLTSLHNYASWSENLTFDQPPKEQTNSK
ncbi:NAD(P)-binding protein [Panus rudis PR-1116 ss-1]|nr:NAD(P)-binding protein [Panus rudis PR-1116 ss-1]